MSEERAGAGKGLLSGALLVTAVGAILLAGFLLRSSGRTEPSSAPRAPAPASSLPLGAEVAPETDDRPAPKPATSAPPAIREVAAAAPLDPLLMELATRAEADAGRLSKAKGPWTAQILVACKPETVERVLEASAGSGRLYVLPARVKDEACFRVCFGDYATSKDAAAAADLPQALRGKDKIGAAEIARVLP